MKDFIVLILVFIFPVFSFAQQDEFRDQIIERQKSVQSRRQKEQRRKLLEGLQTKQEELPKQQNEFDEGWIERFLSQPLPNLYINRETISSRERQKLLTLQQQQQQHEQFLKEIGKEKQAQNDQEDFKRDLVLMDSLAKIISGKDVPREIKIRAWNNYVNLWNKHNPENTLESVAKNDKP